MVEVQSTTEKWRTSKSSLTKKYNALAGVEKKVKRVTWWDIAWDITHIAVVTLLVGLIAFVFGCIAMGIM